MVTETATERGSPRPAILTVDDDPGVSRAVARDLRRKYGADHRIVRAESGAAGLDALRQMKLRGDMVAVILADYRMPEMNGIEFLERAMDVYPSARRALTRRRRSSIPSLTRCWTRGGQLITGRWRRRR